MTNLSACCDVLEPGSFSDFMKSVGSNIDCTFIGSRVSGLEISQGDVETDVPGLESHFVELALESNHQGEIHTDCLISSPEIKIFEGAVSYLPNASPGRIDVRGQGKFFQALVPDALMNETKHSLLAGDPDKAEFYAFNTFYNPALERAMRKLRDALYACSWTSPADLDALTQEICTEIVSNFTTGRVRTNSLAKPTLSKAEVLRAIGVMNAAVSNYWMGTTDIAKEMQLPHTYFCEAFEDATELSPAQYLHERRLDRAIEWIDLMKGSLDVDELATKCGFMSADALNGAVQAKIGVDIKEYRYQ